MCKHVKPKEWVKLLFIIEICVINNEKIKKEDILYISVVSRFPSRYILRIELD